MTITNALTPMTDPKPGDGSALTEIARLAGRLFIATKSIRLRTKDQHETVKTVETALSEASMRNVELKFQPNPQDCKIALRRLCNLVDLSRFREERSFSTYRDRFERHVRDAQRASVTTAERIKMILARLEIEEPKVVDTPESMLADNMRNLKDAANALADRVEQIKAILQDDSSQFAMVEQIRSAWIECDCLWGTWMRRLSYVVFGATCFLLFAAVWLLVRIRMSLFGLPAYDVLLTLLPMAVVAGLMIRTFAVMRVEKVVVRARSLVGLLDPDADGYWSKNSMPRHSDHVNASRKSEESSRTIRRFSVARRNMSILGGAITSVIVLGILYFGPFVQIAVISAGACQIRTGQLLLPLRNAILIDGDSTGSTAYQGVQVLPWHSVAAMGLETNAQCPGGSTPPPRSNDVAGAVMAFSAVHAAAMREIGGAIGHVADRPLNVDMHVPPTRVNVTAQLDGADALLAPIKQLIEASTAQQAQWKTIESHLDSATEALIALAGISSESTGQIRSLACSNRALAERRTYRQLFPWLADGAAQELATCIEGAPLATQSKASANGKP